MLHSAARDAQDRVAVKILEKLKMVTQNTEIKIDVDTYRSGQRSFLLLVVRMLLVVRPGAPRSFLFFYLIFC